MRKGALSNLSVAYLLMDILSQIINNVSEKGLTRGRAQPHIKSVKLQWGNPFALTRYTAHTEIPNYLK